MSRTPVKTRFAPSPTGLLHAGNGRTALFNFLLARHHGGRFLLRLEDTDAARDDERYVGALAEDLAWLGLDWDEGGTDCRQSRRAEVYAEQYRRLLEGGRAYPCFCSAAELERQRRVQLARGEPPRYPGTCARLPRREAGRRLAAGDPATLRFRVQPGEDVTFSDLVRGEQRFRSDDIGDFVVRRADGHPAFFFCNAVDDALMGVTHVLRGDDHLANTPRQLMVLESLGLPAPAYGHLGLLRDDDGAPLSKRRGSGTLADLRAQGYLPAALSNYLARLGHTVDSDTCLGLDALSECFDSARLGRSPARFDLQQLLHWQKLAIGQLPASDLQRWLAAQLRGAVPDPVREAFIEGVRPNVLFPRDAVFWAGILFGDGVHWDDSARARLREAGPEFFARARRALEAGAAGERMAVLKRATGRKGAALYRPLRVALTGLEHGPAIGVLLTLIPAEERSRRLQDAERAAAPVR